jgi:23S rRNA (cytidine1920-2'-O)/16S rRNA (cytidine1409-2'-O)-methyltransferase
MTGQKNRLDRELVACGLTSSVELARAIIMAGEVLVDGQVEYRADRPVTTENSLEIRIKHPFASRGALKIQQAVQAFSLLVEGKTFLDIGISTGGFSDFLLKNGARSGLGVDVNPDQVDYRLKKDGRLRLLQANARDLKPADIGFSPDIIVIDVSFISVIRILPPLAAFPRADILALIKPQFEAERAEVGRGGVIRDTALCEEILMRLKGRVEALKFGLWGVCPAGVRGRRGNQEYFFLLKYGQKSIINDKMVHDVVNI